MTDEERVRSFREFLHRRFQKVPQSRSFTELHAWADYFEEQIESPDRTDDVRWLRRKANEYRRRAEKKEDALLQKLREGRGFKQGERWMRRKDADS